jgi:WD40 repeat protein/uncharacterized caspase-like protein
MLDTGGHGARINGIAFTPDGKYLVSAGTDKVVRVWDWRAGRTVRTIRGESGPGSEGAIYAMALSPNGRWLAVGGWMTPSGSTKNDDVGDIRLYDFETGELKALLKGHQDVVFALAFSSDSKLLISGGADFRAVIWNVETRQLLHSMQGHADQIDAVRFTPDGLRVVTASHDRTLRLWNVGDGRLIKVLQGHSDWISSLAVSPKDGAIASGDSSGEIRHWNGKTGAPLRSLARTHGYVGSLSFSPDGRLLLATCGFAGCDYRQRVYDAASGKELVSYAKHENSVLASTFSPDGQLVATGGANQEIHVWDSRTGETKAVLKGTGSKTWAVAFSPDSRAFAWGSTYRSGSHNDRGPLEMSFRLPSADEPLGEPERVTSQNGWVRAQDKLDDKLGGWSLRHRAGGSYGYDDAILDVVQDGKVQKSIQRDATDGYHHLGYGFTPDGNTIISAGSSGVLTAYDRDGAKIADFVGHERDVWAMAVSPDGRYLVSGSDDQTVRLWNVASRALLVSLFYGNDGEWVMWTPEGFFTRSRNGGDRVGWQINHGPDKAADYVTVTGEQMRDALFRPDLVAAKILGDPDGKVKAAATEVNIADVIKSGHAPEVTVVSPTPGSKAQDLSVTVTAKITDKGGGIGRIAWRVNGKEVGIDYGPSALNAEGEITRSFDLAATDNKIEVVAENSSNKVASLPAAIGINVEKRSLEAQGLPDLYILALGVDDYNDAKHKLEFAVSDAKELSAALADAGKDYYGHPPQVLMLPNDQVTAERVTAAFTELGRKVRANDVFLFFVAGHGKAIDGDYYFVPETVSSFTDDAIRAQGFNPKQLRDWLANIKAQKSVLIFDTCDAGAAIRIFRDRAGESPEEVAQQRMKAATGRAMFMATSDQDVANEGYKNHGVLTYTLLEGLAKAGDEKNRMIYLTDLKDYVEINVPKYSREMQRCHVQRQQEYCQKPLVPLDADNFALVPRYAAILSRLGVTEVAISRTPTHVTIAAADLMASATRGEVKRQLPAGALVAVVKTEGDWAYVAQNGVALGYVRQDRLLKLSQ